MDRRGEQIISTWKRACFPKQNGLKISGTHTERRVEKLLVAIACGDTVGGRAADPANDRSLFGFYS